MKRNKNLLRRLELQGFKSFAPKTVFELADSAVGVIGPNGSGKSNIIDSIRWVLGERGAKHLRGETLDNLIFAGTPKKQAASLARVTLIFDNSNDLFPIDAEEVSLTRRVDRSGNSTFFLNNEETRLKDLEPILARARLGSRSFMIIGQGQHQMFVGASSQERRMMIEEVLGLKEFRIKKKIAQRRLEKSEQNMKTLQAKIDELTPHLRFLKRQKDKWNEKETIEQELTVAANEYFAHFFQVINEKIINISTVITKITKERDKKNNEVKMLDKELSNLRGKDESRKNEEVRSQIRRLQSERLNLERELARAEARAEFIKKSNKSIERSSSLLIQIIKEFLVEAEELIKGDKDSYIVFVKKWRDKFTTIFNNEKSKDDNVAGSNIESIKSNLRQLNGELSDLEKSEAESIELQKEQNKALRSYVDDLEIKRGELRSIENSLQKHFIDKERLMFRKEELEHKWQSLGFSVNDLDNLTENNDPDRDWATLERRIDLLRSKLSAMGDIDNDLIEEADEIEDRHTKFVSELADIRKASDDLNRLIEDLDTRIHNDFKEYFNHINQEFNNYFRLMFGGGKAKLKLVYPKIFNEDGEEDLEKEAWSRGEKSEFYGVDVTVDLPKKKIKNLEMLSGGEKSLVSLAALFALASVSPPPFLVLDEIDAALDDVNSRRFANLIEEFADKTQFLIVTHNRVTMEAVDALYGITMSGDGISRVLSMRFEEAEALAE